MATKETWKTPSSFSYEVKTFVEVGNGQEVLYEVFYENNEDNEVFCENNKDNDKDIIKVIQKDD